MNCSIANPTNAKHMQAIAWQITQDGTGGWTLGFGTKFKYKGASPSGVINVSLGPNDRNYIGVVYDQVNDVFDILAFVAGS